jgi:hypothetical protein
MGNPVEKISEFCKENSITTIVTDFSPLRKSREWKSDLEKSVKFPLITGTKKKKKKKNSKKVPKWMHIMLSPYGRLQIN